MKIIKWDREIYKIMINTTIGKIKKNYLLINNINICLQLNSIIKVKLKLLNK